MVQLAEERVKTASEQDALEFLKWLYGRTGGDISIWVSQYDYPEDRERVDAIVERAEKLGWIEQSKPALFPGYDNGLEVIEPEVTGGDTVSITPAGVAKVESVSIRAVAWRYGKWVAGSVVTLCCFLQAFGYIVDCCHTAWNWISK
ncbi:MAG: hypothetical protein ACM359_03745 [Bacillota bacterium]